MRLPNDLGRKEGTAAAVGTLLLSFVYYCILSYKLRGSILGMEESLIQQEPFFLVSLLLFGFCLFAAYVTVRFLVISFLRRRAYRIRKGKEWQKWRSQIEGTEDDA